MNTSPILSFGIEVDGCRSSTWRIRSGARLPELYFEHEALAGGMHLSLHASGEWHLKIGRKAVSTWSRPAELAPGLTRAITIVQTPSLAWHTETLASDAVFVPTTADADATHFNIFYESPGQKADSWPGKNAMKSALVGRIPLAGDVGNCCVVAHQEPLQPGQLQISPTEDEATHIKSIFEKRGRLGLQMFGQTPDGAISIIELVHYDDSPLNEETAAGGP